MTEMERFFRFYEPLRPELEKMADTEGFAREILNILDFRSSTVGERMRYLRNRKSLSMEKCLDCDLAAVKHQISDWERDIVTPSDETLKKWAVFFEVPLVWLQYGYSQRWLEYLKKEYWDLKRKLDDIESTSPVFDGDALNEAEKKHYWDVYREISKPYPELVRRLADLDLKLFRLTLGGFPPVNEIKEKKRKIKFENECQLIKRDIENGTIIESISPHGEKVLSTSDGEVTMLEYVYQIWDNKGILG